MKATLRIEHITPEMAKRYLATQGRNRKVRPSHVDALAQAITGGTFLYTGDPIRFNTAGELIDGQHRLLAVVKTGCAIKAVIVTDIDPEGMRVIDTGIKRTPGDIFGLLGYTDSNNLTATLRWLWRYDHGFMIAYPRKPQTADLQAAMESHPYVKDSLVVGGKTNKLIVRSLGAALHCLCMERNAVAGHHFFEQLSQGEGIYKGDAVFMLRSRLLKNATTKAKLPAYEVAALVIKAFNAYRKDQPVKTLKWSTEGVAPEPFPSLE